MSFQFSVDSLSSDYGFGGLWPNVIGVMGECDGLCLFFLDAVFLWMAVAGRHFYLHATQKILLSSYLKQRIRFTSF
jgi:hypothetical protein